MTLVFATLLIKLGDLNHVKIFRIIVFLVVFFPLSCLGKQNWVKPKEGLDVDGKLAFWTGFSLFRSPWVAAPASTKGRDGLGPLFNARSCDACHMSGGAGKLPGQGFGAVLRLSAPNSKIAAYKEHAVYGEQLQTHSIDSITGAEDIPSEGQLTVGWEPVTLTIGEKDYLLRKPNVNIRALKYGSLSGRQSLRLAPVLFGLGDADALSEDAILANEDIYDENGDGISGKANRVWDVDRNIKTVGRFGHKAEQPNLLQQIAAAFHQDIGITSWLYPKQNCNTPQVACSRAPSGNSKDEGVEISREKLLLVKDFTANIDYPDHRVTPENQVGAHLFAKVGCASCHINKTLSGGNLKKTQVLYSDFLLHDMGEGLSDGRPVGDALAREWRTSPLLGISRKISNKEISLLHDGRAQSITEAILWHGGEAAGVRKKYLALNQDQKNKVLDFIQGL